MRDKDKLMEQLLKIDSNPHRWFDAPNGVCWCSAKNPFTVLKANGEVLVVTAFPIELAEDEFLAAAEQAAEIARQLKDAEVGQ